MPADKQGVKEQNPLECLSLAEAGRAREIALTLWCQVTCTVILPWSLDLLFPEPWRFLAFFSNLGHWVSAHCFPSTGIVPQWELLTKTFVFYLLNSAVKWHRSQSCFWGLSWESFKTQKFILEQQVPIHLQEAQLVPMSLLLVLCNITSVTFRFSCWAYLVS